MTHSDVQSEQLSAYLDGELAGEVLREIEDHIITCDACQTTLSELQQVRQLVQASLAAQSVPFSVEERIRVSIVQAHQDAEVGRGLIVYACCLALVVAGVLYIALSPLGRIVRLVWGLLFTATGGVFRVIAATGVLWPTVIGISSILVGIACVLLVVRMLRSSEVTV